MNSVECFLKYLREGTVPSICVRTLPQGSNATAKEERRRKGREVLRPRLPRLQRHQVGFVQQQHVLSVTNATASYGIACTVYGNKRHAAHSAARRLSRESGEVGGGVEGWGLGCGQVNLGTCLVLSVSSTIASRSWLRYSSGFRASTICKPFAVRFSQCSVATRSAFRPTIGRPPFVRVCSTHSMQRRKWYVMLHVAWRHGACCDVSMLYIARRMLYLRCVPHAVPPHAAGRE